MTSLDKKLANGDGGSHVSAAKAMEEGTATNIGRRSKKQTKDDGEHSLDGSVVIERKSLWLITLLIVVMGVATSSAFLIVGVRSANSAQEDEFERSAQDLVQKIQSAWNDYVTAASWIHGRCRDREFDRKEFREIYEYLVAGGLDFQAAQFDPNITHAEREFYEEEARAFYAENYPHIEYRGIIGFNYDNSTTLDPRNDAPFYLPIRKCFSI